MLLANLKIQDETVYKKTIGEINTYVNEYGKKINDLKNKLGIKYWNNKESITPEIKEAVKILAFEDVDFLKIKRICSKDDFEKIKIQGLEEKNIVGDDLENARKSIKQFFADLPDDLKLNIRGAKISQIYKRLDPTKPAYTVTGSGGGGTHIYHWKEPRALTNRERARLQTFPDTYVFEGNKESVRKQIGMAVPCRGAQIIFEAILKTFAGIPYDSMPANIDE